MSRMNDEEGLGMSDEEKAEAYFKTTYPAYIGCDKFTEDIKDAVIYGLKARKTKWHKVADGDLPSEEGGWVCNQDGLPCFFDWSTGQWIDCEGTQIRTTEWCHMPHKE